MSKLVFKVILLLLPFIVILGYIEHRLSKLHNTYQKKRDFLERILPEVEVLSLGSSNAFYAVDPAFFSVKGYNAAYRVQSHWYDVEIALKYLDRMPKLKVVLIPVIYLTLGTNQEDHVDKWRIFFYEQVFKIRPTWESARRSYGFNYWFDPRRFSYIALYGERTPDYILSGFRDDIGEDVALDGWHDPGDRPMDVSFKIGRYDANEQNLLVKTRRYAENLGQIQRLVDALKKRNVVPVLLQLPAHSEISRYWDKEKLLELNRSLEAFARENRVGNFNYMSDPRFDAADFTDMPDHLNRKGAEKISVIINREIILPALAGRRPGASERQRE